MAKGLARGGRSCAKRGAGYGAEDFGETLPLGQSASASKADSALTWGPWCSFLLSPLTA